MSMFKPTSATTVEDHLALVDEPRRSDIEQLHHFIRQTVPKLKPIMIHGMLGYGPYHYKYDSGREGDTAIISLASQKQYISVYVFAVDGDQYVAEKYKAELPKANIGKSCIRFKKVADIDLTVLKRILLEAERVMS